MRLTLDVLVMFLLGARLVAASDKNGCHNTADPHEGLPKNICSCPDGSCYNDLDNGLCEDLSKQIACII
ncbi:unnamed protein product [Penicillium palitans]